MNPSDVRNFHTLRASCIIALRLDSIVAEKPSNVFFTMILSFSMPLFVLSDGTKISEYIARSEQARYFRRSRRDFRDHDDVLCHLNDYHNDIRDDIAWLFRK